MDKDLQALVHVFQTESGENLSTIEQSLLALERSGEPDHDLVRTVLRAAHTLKGNSSTIGFDSMAAEAHALEDELERILDGSLQCTPALITSLLERVDVLRGLLRAEATDAAHTLTLTPSAAAPESRPAARAATLRVNIGRLDALLDLTAEVTIARGQLTQSIGPRDSGNSAVGAALDHLEQLHAALQEEVMKLRMVPLGPMLRSHYRTVREVARSAGKQVDLVIEGHDVEVDTSIAEQMRDPLTHMLRNAVDHGIEPPAERKAAGKPATGRITLRAVHRAGAVVLELADDGRGLDLDRLTAKAVAAGIVSDPGSLSDEQRAALIFEPGLSTAHAVTSVSGRGVGMDIVRRHIRGLRGSIGIATTPGKGTRFTIRLPLTVAIIDGFQVGVMRERYILPLEAVEECLAFDGVDTAGAGGGVLNVRGMPVPYVRLHDVLGLPDASHTRESVVVVRHGERRVGLVVDALEGDCQAVIKPLSGALQQVPGIAGSTLLGDGRVALILDVGRLSEMAGEFASDRTRAETAAA